MAEVEENDTQVSRARSAKPHQRAKSARHRSQHANEVNNSDMRAGSLSSVDSGTGSVPKEEIPSSDDDLSPPRDPNQPVKRVDQTIPWRKQRPATSVSTRRQRPKSQSGSAKPKNNRPKSCHITSQYTPDHPGYVEYLRPFSAFRAPLKRVVNVPDAFSNSYLLQHPSLSAGQKNYLWHTASVYSITNLKHLQQRKYEQMIQHQVDIGLHNPKDCERYIKYLLGQRQRQFDADPRIWRNPPRIAPRGRYYHKRDKTVDYESDEDDEEQEPPPRRPQTAISSSGYGRLNTSRSRPKSAYEKKSPAGQPSDRQLYYDTKDRQLKSPDQRKKGEEEKKEKEKEKKEKEKKERERSRTRGKRSQNNDTESPRETHHSENSCGEKKQSNIKKKERKSEIKPEEENIETQRTDPHNKKPSTKKDSPKRASSKNSKEKENPKEDKNNQKEENSRRRSIKKDKTPKEPEAEVANNKYDEDDRAIETVQQDNDLVSNTDKEEIHPTVEPQPTEEELVEDSKTYGGSKVQIFVGEELEEPNELKDYEREEDDDIGEFNPIFENRLKQQKPDDAISVYSSFSVDIAITKAQAPSELEY